MYGESPEVADNLIFAAILIHVLATVSESLIGTHVKLFQRTSYFIMLFV